MPNDLTPQQKIMLQILRDYKVKHGISPTLGELKKYFGFSSTSSVVHLLEKLEERGYIRREGERGIEIVGEEKNTMDIPVIGAAACGKPLLAQENFEGYITVDKNLIKGDSSKYFFLRAVGDSMDLAGIENGDYVLFKADLQPQQNDRIVALINDEATIKIFRPGEGYVALIPQSSNPANKPIILHEDFTIQGVVKAVYKKEMLTA